MIDNFNKCCECGIQNKEEDIITNNSNKTKPFQCKNCFQKNLLKESQIIPDLLANDKEKINIILKNDKKLDLKEPIIKINETNFLKKKKRRISKNIVFKRKKSNKKIDEFTSVIYKIIEQSNKELLINYKDKDKDKDQNLGLNTFCNICKKIKLSKIIKLTSFNEFKDLFVTIYKILEQEENSEKLMQIFQNKYEQIIQNKKDINQIKINDINKEISSLKMPQNYCFECIYNYLLKNNGINILWENLQKEDGHNIENANIKKNFEIISGLKDIQTNSSKNNINFNENNINEEKKEKNDNNDNNDNNDIFDNDINKMFNDKKLNIFDLILGDEDNDNDINDFENNSDENKSMKNKNNDNKQLNDKKIKKNKKGKIKEKKITFKKIIIPNNIQLNKNNINNNLNNNIKEENDKNLSNINNVNNMAQFNDLKYNIKKNQENNQPLFFNINNNSNNNYLQPNTINNNNNNNLYINNNNNMPKLGEDVVYNRLVNQISFLKNKLCLISNLNRTRKANSNNININAPIFIPTNNFVEILMNYKTSMDIILNYMDNIGEILDKISCINENSLSLMNAIFNNNINSNTNLVQLESNSNYFSQLLNYNYNMQRMNGELCEIINKQLSM